VTAVRNYADSHPVVRISSKRFRASPYLANYVTDDTVLGVYGGRFYPLSLGADPVADYWHLRRRAALFDVPERPIEIVGPDAERYLDHLLTRDLSTVRPGWARYALACDQHGGILMDGVLIRLGRNRFWYVLADGDFLGWMLAHAEPFDVTVSDPDSWVLQVQGPTSLSVLSDVVDNQLPDPFPYFGVAEVSIAGQPVLVSRTGWSGELGFEVYTLADTDPTVVWNRLLTGGAAHGLQVQSLESLGIRRIEAGILDNGSDMTAAMTPYDVGLGKFVALDKPSFVGREALERAGRRPRLFGLASDVLATPGQRVSFDGSAVGTVVAGAWSPRLDQGVGYVVMDVAVDWLGRDVALGGGGTGQLVTLPFYDAERAIPRGLAVAADVTGA
jgi:glycine cleavage system aminomethyltransferase T